MNKYPNRSQDISDDEIDLGLLLLKITKTTKRNAKLILSFSVFGLLCGLAYFFTVQPKYESTMVISSKVLTKQNAANLIESLQELIEDENNKLLSLKLSIDSVAAAKISEIAIEELEDEPESEPEKQAFLEIAVTVTDTGILPELQKGIIDFLENNQYVNQRVALRKERYKALIQETQQEIDQIDSLKKRVDAGLLLQSQGPNVVMMEPVNIYTASLALFEKKQNYIEQLELVSSIHLVKGFIAFKNPVSPKLTVCVVVGLALGLILAVIVVFIAETGIYLRKLNREHYSKENSGGA